MSFNLHHQQRDGLSLLNKISIHQIESIFLSHVIPVSPDDSDLPVQVVREVGGVENVTKLISSLKQLMQDVNFFSVSEDQVKQQLTSGVNGLSAVKAELISKLCQDNMSDWKRNQMDSDSELLQSVDWNLKMISCSSDGPVREPRVQLQFNTGEKGFVSMDADQAGMRSLYKNLEEVQLKLDQMAKSTRQKQ